jgi:DNA polymerase I-like protein with 3'-5' exonuclease and polymerase domains
VLRPAQTRPAGRQASCGPGGVMEYIRTEAGLERVVDALRGEPLFAADTEAAGYHRYHDRICLVQLSTRRETFLVDTLEIKELKAIAPLFASREHEIVLHDADYDLRLLARDHDIHVNGLFDTKLAAQRSVKKRSVWAHSSRSTWVSAWTRSISARTGRSDRCRRRCWSMRRRTRGICRRCATG